ncbi:MAG: hypothetical protein IH991_04880 [Planctomycetes bacterium]|nr:hypothetical protein [Planctomycetota bacterium]
MRPTVWRHARTYADRLAALTSAIDLAAPRALAPCCLAARAQLRVWIRLVGDARSGAHRLSGGTCALMRIVWRHLSVLIARVCSRFRMAIATMRGLRSNERKRGIV